MLNMLFSGFILIFSIHAFSLGLVFKAANNAYVGLYKGVVESAVTYYGDNGERLQKPYFQYRILVANLDKYFERELKPHVESYRYSLECYNRATGVVTLSEPDAVEIILRVKVFGTDQYQRTASFVIKEGNR